MSATRIRELLLVVLLNLCAMGVLAARLRDPRATAVRIEIPPTATAAPSATPVRLHVHVSGAVRRPDVVELPEGSRVRDAVLAAGGFSESADQAGVNLAATLVDGVQLHVPAEGELPAPAAGVVAAGGGAAGGGQAVGGGGGSGAGPINVNNASAAQLETLPGIGPALAARIIAHRDANGPFGAYEDLIAVSGIGSKTLERLQGLVIVR